MIKIRSIEVFPTWQTTVPDRLYEKTALIIDVLRASNTIITALQNKALEIIPVENISSAWELKKKYPQHLLGGERKSEKITGFDFGNSPLEYTREKIEDKAIIFTTSNGSKALKISENAQHVFVASLANASSVAKKLTKLTNDIAIICAGTLGHPSLEDTLAAGKIIDTLKDFENYRLNDYGYLSLGCYHNYKSDIYNIITKSQNGRRLRELFKEEDIKYCSQVDFLDLVPGYQKGKIQL